MKTKKNAFPKTKARTVPPPPNKHKHMTQQYYSSINMPCVHWRRNRSHVPTVLSRTKQRNKASKHTAPAQHACALETMACSQTTTKVAVGSDNLASQTMAYSQTTIKGAVGSNNLARPQQHATRKAEPAKHFRSKIMLLKCRLHFSNGDLSVHQNWSICCVPPS